MQKKFYDSVNGKEVYLYTIKNDNIEIDVCDLGARINALRVNGTDIVLGFNSYADYMCGGYAGATVGRVANRIANGKFILNGKIYNLNTNDGANHLHGGNEGFDKKPFEVTELTENSVTMKYVSADGEENYPGKLEFTVKFTVENNSLLIEFNAISDKDTLDKFEFDNDNVAKAFLALSVLRQQILTLMFVRGKTAEQVAKILGRSVKHVFNEKSLALKQIRNYLGKK